MLNPEVLSLLPEERGEGLRELAEDVAISKICLDMGDRWVFG